MRVFLNDRLMIVTKEGFIEVKIFNKKKDTIEGLGYIENGLVYIYHGRLKSSNPKPGLYHNDYETKSGKIKKEYIFIGTDVDNKNIFDVSEIIELDASSIFDNLNKDPENFVKDDEMDAINSDRDIYVPIIKDSDDFLKVAIKKAIISKKINLKRKYKNKFGQQHQLTNMLSALKGDTKMSVIYFIYWTNLLGLDWELTLFDNGRDPLNPLDNEVVMKG